MADYIEREATIKLLRSLGSRDYRREKGTIQEAIKMVSFPEYTPSADVAPVRHGRWNLYERAHYFKCSLCAETVPYRKACLFDGRREYKYCPSCGAKMMEDLNEQKE